VRLALAALAAVVAAAGLGVTGAGAYTTKLVTVRNLVVVNCNRQTKTFCDAATPNGRLIVLFTGRRRFATVPRLGSRLDVRGFDVRDPSDAYLGVLALEVPNATAKTTMTRTGTAPRLVVHGKVGRVTESRVGFVSVRWVRSPVGGPVIGNVYERFSFRASAALRAKARTMQWDRVQRLFDRETWAFTLRLDRGSYRLVGLRRDG
jgi:hypothetical protein